MRLRSYTFIAGSLSLGLIAIPAAAQPAPDAPPAADEPPSPDAPAAADEPSSPDAPSVPDGQPTPTDPAVDQGDEAPPVPDEEPPAAGSPTPSPEPDPNALRPPKLKTFVEAAYPADLRAKGIQGNVELALTIDAEGRVTEVTVLTSSGEEKLDEAAVGAAKAFIFEPAQRGDSPIASRIRYTYRFAIEEEPEPEIEPDPAGGEIAGRLLFGSDNPLVGAKVTATGPDGKRVVARTGADGRFRFPELPVGSYRLRIEADGFEGYSSTEKVEEAQATDLVLRLKIARGLNEVLVEGEREDEARPLREVTRRTLTRREMNRIPGTAGDALRSVQSLPGVARPPALAGLLIVRGSAPQDTGIFIDQTTVPLIYHFGGLASVVPTEMLDRIDFYPSNFGVRY
ncbi:MAG: TonB family protein, partial [Myxococcota bacterium]